MTPYEPNTKRLNRRDSCPYPRQRTQSVCSASCCDCSDVCDQERCNGTCRPCNGPHAADGAFAVRKIDPATGAGLAGAIFELRRGTHTVSRSVTDADGRILYANLPDGEYTLVEIEPPRGYLRMEVPQLIAVRDGAYIVNGTEADTLLLPDVSAARIDVTALHGETGEPVPGCVLSLSSESAARTLAGRTLAGRTLAGRTPAEGGSETYDAQQSGQAAHAVQNAPCADAAAGAGRQTEATGPENSDNEPGPEQVAVTDNAGEAVFSGLRPGAYLLRVREAAQGLCAQREVFPVLVREDGAYAERVELRLSACADLRVSCLGEEQEPRFGIRLRLTDAEGGVQERRTDGTGAAAFRALEAGAYTLTEQGPDGLIRQYAVTVDSWGLVRVDGVPTRTLRLRRPGPGGVEVRVRGEDGRPLPGVRVTAASSGGPLGEQVTDAWGAVVFHTLPTDGCTLTALPPAGFQAPKTAVFTEDRTAWQAEITLAPLDGTAYVDGHIVWEDFDNAYRSRPLGMTLNLYCNGALCRQQMVSTAGAEYYRFSGLPCTDPDGEDFQYDVRQAFDMPGYRAQTRPGLLYNRLQTASVRVSYTDGFTMLDLAGQDAYTVYRGAPLSVRFKPVYGYEPVPPLSFSLAHVTETEEVTFFYHAAKEAD